MRNRKEYKRLKITHVLLICGCFILISCSNNKENYEGHQTTEEALEWLNEAKFGMFVHWGLYSIPAGEWKGLQVPYISEWIMKRAEISYLEYEKLAKEFNPREFDAEEWVRVIKDAGMKYIIITSKHHDGFAMFDSPSSEYDIADATPYGKDPLKMLADACHRNDIKLGFYYSNDQDWHHPDASGNDWDFDPGKKDFQRYLDEKVKPQVRELLTNYGPVAIIWFDTPMSITPSQSKELVEFVHAIQPGCLVSDRVGHGMGDYKGFGDNQVPEGKVDGIWETCGTTNDSWAVKKSDNNWKSPEILVKLLTNIVGKGGVYLLNVGPYASGKIPAPAIQNLKEVGRWLKVNGEAIYGAEPSPYDQEFDWGSITKKGNTLYLHLYEIPEDQAILLPGFHAEVSGISLLADKENTLTFFYEGSDLWIELPENLQADHLIVPVITVKTEGEIEVDNTIRNKQNGIITLPAHRADLHLSEESEMEVKGGGVTQNFILTEDFLTWEFFVDKPGKYNMQVVVANHHWTGFNEGNIVSVKCNGMEIQEELIDSYRMMNLNTLTWQDSPTAFQSITMIKPGQYSLELKPVKLNKKGLRLRRIDLVPDGMDYKTEYADKIQEPFIPIEEEMKIFQKELSELNDNSPGI